MPGKLQLSLCTCPDREARMRSPRPWSGPGLAACVNQLPGVTSTYRWDGKLCHEEEVMLIDQD